MLKEDQQKKNEIIEKLTQEFEESKAKYRELESRCSSLEKMLERKEEEIKFYRNNDNSRTSQLKEELFNFQQQSQEREAELNRDLARTRVHLEKAQHQIELLTQSGATIHKSNGDTDIKNMDTDEIKDLYTKTEYNRRQLESQIRLLQDEMQAQEFIKEKEIQVVKARKEEEFNRRLVQTRSEWRNDIEKVKKEYNAKLKQIQKESEDKLVAQINRLQESIQDKDARKTIEYVI
jgi:hypothetical protein